MNFNTDMHMMYIRAYIANSTFSVQLNVNRAEGRGGTSERAGEKVEI